MAGSSSSSSEPATVTAAKGTVVKAKQGCVVQRPDGSTHIIVGGTYVLDVEGDHYIDGSKVTVE